MDEGDRDPCYWQFGDLGYHVCNSPRTLQDHAGCAIHHGVIQGLRGETWHVVRIDDHKETTGFRMLTHVQAAWSAVQKHTHQRDGDAAVWSLDNR